MTRAAGQMSVLLLDGQTISALSILRSLGRKGISVDIGSAALPALAGLSKYCRRHFVYPSPATDSAAFQSAIIERIGQSPYSLVIPVTDMTICPLME
ncbi:MAG: hypothetical protein MN733_40525, partial [Nitrososphaera sp.]|nr:hypothetical protein [Nitrososphaera sp.]